MAKKREDHDQRLKRLLWRLLPEFFRAFLPEKAALVDWSALSHPGANDVFPGPPQGPRRAIDLVFRTKELASPQRPLALWLEVEAAKSLTDLRGRMPEYHFGLKIREEMPIYPVALLLKAKIKGAGADAIEERVLGDRINLFEYPYVALGGLKGRDWVERGELPAALTGLMKVPKADRVSVAVRALDLIGQSEHNEETKSMLTECLMTYTRWESLEVREAFQQTLQAPQHTKAMAMVGSILDEWRIKYEKKGLRRGTRASLLALGTDRLGQPDEQVRAALRGVKDVNELLRLLVKVPTVASWEALFGHPAPNGKPAQGDSGHQNGA